MTAYSDMGVDRFTLLACQAFQQIFSPFVGQSFSKAAALFIDLERAKERACARLRDPGVIYPENDVHTFGITSTIIGGKTAPVEVTFERIGKTGEMWHFRCAEHADKAPVVWIGANSSGHISSFEPTVEAFLPYRNFSLIGTRDPNNLDKRTPYSVAQQRADVITGLIEINQATRHGFILGGTSQGGHTAAAVAGELSAHPEEFNHLCPSDLVLVAAPIDKRVNESEHDKAARIFPIRKDLFTQGANGRIVFPHEVMSVLIQFMGEEIPPDCLRQDLDGQHISDMHENLSGNLLAEGKLADIRCDLFKGGLCVVEADGDKSVRLGQTRAARHLFTGVAGQDYGEMVLVDQNQPGSVGHYDTVRRGRHLANMAREINNFIERPRP